MNKRRSFKLASIVIGSLVSSAVNAQSANCYTAGSLQGSWAMVGDYGANVAIALGTVYFDGTGNLSGTQVLNQPTVGSATGQRTLATGLQSGTYTVNCDGSGTFTRLVPGTDGATKPSVDDFLITGAIQKDGLLIATAMVDAQRTPGVAVPEGVFLSRSYSRLPSGGNFGGACFNLQSLQGSYSVAVHYGANLALGLELETLDGKGNLKRTGVLNQPVAGSPTGERMVGNVTSTGTYTMNCNGTGAIDRVVTLTDGTKAIASDDFLITSAVEVDRQLVATTIVDAQRDPSVILPGGVFTTRVHTLRPPQATGSGTTPPTTQTVAIAGPKNLTVTTRTIQLDGSQSTSADGKPLTYLWSIPQGSPSAAIIGGTTATPIVQFSQGRGTYAFQLTVTDSTGKSASDIVTVLYQGN